ncbi:MAG: IS701 family transposase, partial [Chloroflexi bacterium]|nr:IS701 family transposase [Chloroflexota bacterium]MBM3180765.1 IS701 family transposase [Chloroflexota bacterium]MBM3181016.1 IS701 family transposase [Chloroflexota bacterium]MBM3181298.1 IS701 family transposase [Chloroflexota bacterium]MBM3181330.1 IS701 family transposase [Chloroflexota bacterium]
MKNGKLLDLYSDYLISAFGQTSATGLSSLLNGEVSHDQTQRWLAGEKQT